MYLSCVPHQLDKWAKDRYTQGFGYSIISVLYNENKSQMSRFDAIHRGKVKTMGLNAGRLLRDKVDYFKDPNQKSDV